jgi:hypothetical protein
VTAEFSLAAVFQRLNIGLNSLEIMLRHQVRWIQL